MLNDFRNVDVIWDKATKNFVKKIRVASSDERGRKLTVQIVNDGQIQDLTNVALNLYWETQDGENRGLDPFEPLDAENGIYELYFHTGMLKHVGKLNAHLHLVDTTGAITSEPFTIVVFQGVDVDAMASGNELSALNQALIEVQNIKQDEAERATAEEERVSNENERKNAETIRLTNETDRVDNETDRVNAEDTRKTNETNRVDAESGRVTAETARVTAEEEREQGYPALDGRITAVEQNIDFKNVTSRFTIKDNAVTDLSAYQQGTIYILKFTYKPASTGFNQKIIVPDFSVGGSWPASIATTDMVADAAKGIAAYWGGSGVTVTVPSLPSYPLIFQFVAIY